MAASSSLAHLSFCNQGMLMGLGGQLLNKQVSFIKPKLKIVIKNSESDLKGKTGGS
jgi:hypothetical protein